MNWSMAIRDITLFAVAGAILGLVLGLVLDAAGAVDNPFAVMAVGIAIGGGAAGARYRSWERGRSS